VTETWEISVRSVAFETIAPEPDKSKITSSFGKLVATNWSTTGQLEVSPLALRVYSIRSIARALAACQTADF